MGDTIWVDVQGRRKDELPRDNSIMLRLKAELDRLADELSVPTLSQFYDDSELRAAYADHIESSLMKKVMLPRQLGRQREVGLIPRLP